MTRRPSHRLSDVRTRELRVALEHLLNEAEGWHPDTMSGAYLSLAWLVEITLCCRNHRRKPDARLVALTKGRGR